MRCCRGYLLKRIPLLNAKYMEQAMETLEIISSHERRIENF
jgi:hypothetical protein